MSVDFVFLKTIIKIANPTATSAAATAMMKNTNTCPPASDQKRLKATSNKFTALSINSTHMKITIAFRRYKTPMTPIENKIELNQTYHKSGTPSTTSCMIYILNIKLNIEKETPRYKTDFTLIYASFLPNKTAPIMPTKNKIAEISKGNMYSL